jgi:hypothetical protein
MIATFIHLAVFLFLAYRLRSDLSLGNGFAVSVVWALITLIVGVFVHPAIIFLLLAFLPFIPVLNGFFFKIPILSKVLFELGVPLKNLIRAGIPHNKVEDAIYRTHGVKMSDFKE